MNTKEIMNVALELAGLKEVPEDSGIIVEGNNIKKSRHWCGYGISGNDAFRKAWCGFSDYTSSQRW